MKTPSSLAALCLALAAAPALAGDDCDVPVHRWQSRDAVRQMAAQQGWQVQRLKIDDGCYEVRGQDAQGRAFKATIDPETLQVLKIKRRERTREREREHAPQDARPAPAAPFTPGGAPRGQVE
ncbi:hypothetical protein B2J86_09040 [Acidovorax sp. SRB_14]|uniref:PepSY domain-containing protein n=1 Tax=Acidovorax sp. SRB_14 TaxID=1962699 RepID=UPI00156504D5|nr:PepSY domain-containing protein [Acidovorax sp. SRB_14]NMM81064.1 hypothetical protein [Acidovorax sp. SRB_14]